MLLCLCNTVCVFIYFFSSVETLNPKVSAVCMQEKNDLGGKQYKYKRCQRYASNDLGCTDWIWLYMHVDPPVCSVHISTAAGASPSFSNEYKKEGWEKKRSMERENKRDEER